MVSRSLFNTQRWTAVPPSACLCSGRALSNENEALTKNEKKSESFSVSRDSSNLEKTSFVCFLIQTAIFRNSVLMQHLTKQPYTWLFSAKPFTWTLHLLSSEKKNQNSEISSPNAKVTQLVVDGSILRPAWLIATLTSLNIALLFMDCKFQNSRKLCFYSCLCSGCFGELRWFLRWVLETDHRHTESGPLGAGPGLFCRDVPARWWRCSYASDIIRHNTSWE